MQIDIKFKDDMPHSMAMDLVNEMTELAKLFDALSSENKKLKAVVELVERGSRMAMPPDLVSALDNLKQKP